MAILLGVGVAVSYWAEAAGNPLILALLDSIVDVLREERLGVFAVPGGPTRGQIYHKLILKAIRA